jgi:hypothetical protein
VSVYNAQHLDLKEYDLRGPKGSLYGGYRWGPLKARLHYQYAYYWLDTHSYLRQHGVGPNFWWTQAPWAKLQATYLFTKNDYFDLPGRDGFNHRAGITQYFFCKQRAQIRAYYFFDTDLADGDDFDYRGHEVGIFGAVTLPWMMRARGEVNYYARRYLHCHSIFGEKRKDDRWTLTLDIARGLTRFLELSLAYTRVLNNSNIDVFEYTRNVVTLQLRATF